MTREPGKPGSATVPVAFASPRALRAWLAEHHATAAELHIRLFKVHAGHQGVTYAEALDEALCFGWIDGVRRSVDGDSFSVRFTPRKRGSKWSAVNVRHAMRLEAAKRMHAIGLAAFRGREREHKKTRRYSYEARSVARLAPEFEKELKSDRQALADFNARPPWYRRTSVFWVMDAKRKETRARRFTQLLACSRQGKPLPLLARP